MMKLPSDSFKRSYGVATVNTTKAVFSKYLVAVESSDQKIVIANGDRVEIHAYAFTFVSSCEFVFPLLTGKRFESWLVAFIKLQSPISNHSALPKLSYC